MTPREALLHGIPYHRDPRREARASAGSRDHESPANGGIRLKTGSRAWTRASALVFPQCSLGGWRHPHARTPASPDHAVKRFVDPPATARYRRTAFCQPVLATRGRSVSNFPRVSGTRDGRSGGVRLHRSFLRAASRRCYGATRGGRGGDREVGALVGGSCRCEGSRDARVVVAGRNRARADRRPEG